MPKHSRSGFFAGKVYIFPYSMRKIVKKICCVEPEPNSARFINNELDLLCYTDFYSGYYLGKFDLVTLVHVLEHFEHPLMKLHEIREESLTPSGKVFIEVPDALEFATLPKDHDEFNSLHLSFFSVQSLDKLLREAGLNPYLFERIEYKDRGLKRIRVMCNA